MADFLLELLSEEIPARMQAKARADLERLFVAQMDEAGLKAFGITVYSTPRRLTLIAKDLPEQTEAVSEESKGPPEAAPDQAVDGFCRKNGVTREQLEVRDVKGRPTYFAVIDKPGQDSKDVLAAAIPAIIRAFPWPKSMRWGEQSQSTESLRWVRPLSGIVALFGSEVVACEIDGVTSGFDSVGHRFHHQVPNTVRAEPVEAPLSDAQNPSTSSGRTEVARVTIGNAGDYIEKLRDAHVLVDHEERQNIVRDGATKAASDAGLELVEDEGLVNENAGLTEWPVPLLGSFDPAFLDVPEEVIQLTARVNQKYFVVHDKAGNLAPNFVCTANIDASDGGKAIVAGNEKVLAARLADAKFFWELDQKTPLEDHAKKLSNIVFHEKLGTVADKVERVAKLAEWLVSLEGNGLDQPNPGEAFHGEVTEAARLCKADLVTEMVGEFPDLQGLMGGYYAEKQGKSAAIANAIRDHYKPVGQGDEVPTDPVTVAVSLADKLDTLGTFFLKGMMPTGSKDPFALRRAAIGVIELVQENNLRIDLQWPLTIPMTTVIGNEVGGAAVEGHQQLLKALENAGYELDAEGVKKLEEEAKGRALSKETSDAVLNDVLEPARDRLISFFADRLKVQQRVAGVRHDLIDAVFALGIEGDLVRLLARVKALQAFVETEDGDNLLAGYKRASNILKKESKYRHPELVSGSPKDGAQSEEILKQVQNDDGGSTLSYTPEPAEKALIDALDAAEPQVTAAIEAEKFEDAMTSLAALRVPIDAFFEDVTVNDDDPAKREARLALLARFRSAVHQVADFSKIEG